MSKACTGSLAWTPEYKSYWASLWVNTETHIFRTENTIKIFSTVKTFVYFHVFFPSDPKTCADVELDNPEWEIKTITSAIKHYLRFVWKGWNHMEIIAYCCLFSLLKKMLSDLFSFIHTVFSAFSFKSILCIYIFLNLYQPKKGLFLAQICFSSVTLICNYAFWIQSSLRPAGPCIAADI